MALPSQGSSLESAEPIVQQRGLNTRKAFNLAGFTGDTSGNLSAPGTLAVAGVATFGVPPVFTTGQKANVLASSGNTTLTTAMSGSVMLLDTATVDYALPAVGAGDVGVYFDFKSTATSTNQTITAQTGDLLVGSLTIVSADVPTADIFAPDGSDDLIISFNGTTSGGVAGSYLRITCISATRWFVEGTLSGSGTAVTPFS